MSGIPNLRTAAALKEAATILSVQPAVYGYENRVNIYVCDRCQEHIVTRDLARGVTPFLVACKCTRACQGMMRSSMYQVFDQEIREGFQWYRPEPHQELTHAELAHVSKGGLLLRLRP